MISFLLKSAIERRLAPLRQELSLLSEEVDSLRSRLDLGVQAFEEFQTFRRSPEYQAAFDLPRPLVSVCIATYNRADLLVQRSLASLLAQTYDNLEILVVGDGCTDHTEFAIASLGDPRIRFVNRLTRGIYPEDPHLRWLVAGTDPANQALDMVRGHFITHLDDDDEHAPNRIQTLLDLLREQRADLAWHPFDFENRKGKWKRMEAEAFRKSQVTTSSVFYHAWFKRIAWDGTAYQYREPGDWNRFRKFRFLGAKIVRHPESLLRHFQERKNTP